MSKLAHRSFGNNVSANSTSLITQYGDIIPPPGPTWDENWVLAPCCMVESSGLCNISYKEVCITYCWIYPKKMEIAWLLHNDKNMTWLSNHLAKMENAWFTHLRISVSDHSWWQFWTKSAKSRVYEHQTCVRLWL